LAVIYEGNDQTHDSEFNVVKTCNDIFHGSTSTVASNNGRADAEAGRYDRSEMSLSTFPDLSSSFELQSVRNRFDVPAIRSTAASSYAQSWQQRIQLLVEPSEVLRIAIIKLRCFIKFLMA
jgi:hypothetical protein